MNYVASYSTVMSATEMKRIDHFSTLSSLPHITNVDCALALPIKSASMCVCVSVCAPDCGLAQILACVFVKMTACICLCLVVITP